MTFGPLWLLVSLILMEDYQASWLLQTESSLESISESSPHYVSIQSTTNVLLIQLSTQIVCAIDKSWAVLHLFSVAWYGVACFGSYICQHDRSSHLDLSTRCTCSMWLRDRSFWIQYPTQMMYSIERIEGLARFIGRLYSFKIPTLLSVYRMIWKTCKV